MSIAEGDPDYSPNACQTVDPMNASPRGRISRAVFLLCSGPFAEQPAVRLSAEISSLLSAAFHGFAEAILPEIMEGPAGKYLQISPRLQMYMILAEGPAGIVGI